MTTEPRITLNHLSFKRNQTPVRFDDINLSFGTGKYGMIGSNGVGKSTLLKLILGELQPGSGSIQINGKTIYIPQNHHVIANNATISDVLGMSQILATLKKIQQASINESDYEIIGDNWDIENKIETALIKFQLWPIDLNRLFHQLSGGQKTKVLLAKTLLFPADFYCFDEPTNNLDRESRHVLYQFIKDTNKSVILISHDRTLLNLCDNIIELTTLGIKNYGGNYDFYQQQKSIEKEAIEHCIQSCTEKLLKAKNQIQTRMERHQQNESHGKKLKKAQIKAKGNYDKIEMNSKKGRSENTNRRIRLQADRKLENIKTKLLLAHTQFEVNEALNISIEKTNVPNHKMIIEIINLCFSYDEKIKLIADFNLSLIGSERIAITGSNGCGKSTLIKLIQGLLNPDSGKISIGVENIAYLDQTISFLNVNKTLVENYLMLNPNAKLFDAYSALASLKFRNKDAEKIVSELSSGEKMRAGLAISLMSLNPPQLIILDEPTNHLDLTTITAIEEALTLYQGAILAVSHDETFLKNMGINKTIKLG